MRLPQLTFGSLMEPSPTTKIETEFKMIVLQPSCCPCWQNIEASANDLAEVTAFADAHAGEAMEDAS